MVPLPPDWSAGRSMAALIGFAGSLTGDRLSTLQLDLARWELEKYGPTFHEPFAEVVIADGIGRLSELTPADGRRFVVVHGSEILRRRGREMLDLAMSACARVAGLGPRPNPYLDLMLFDVSTYARGEVSMGAEADAVHLGMDEISDFEMSSTLPVRPTQAQLAANLRLSQQLLDLPATWTPVHALAFLIATAHYTDRAPQPLPANAAGLVAAFAEIYGVTTSATELLAQGEQLYRRCNDRRFVVMRVVEDQVMRFVWLDLEGRTMLLQAIDRFAAVDLTPWRRAIITAAMAVLATSPKALVRARHCPALPALR